MKVRQTVVMFRISSKDITILNDTVSFRFTDAETCEEHEVSEPKSKVDIWRDTRFSDEYIVCIWKWIFCKSLTLMRYADRICEFYVEHDFTHEDILNASLNKI